MAFKRPDSKPFRIAEFFILFVILPGLIIGNRWAPYMLPFLWSVTIYCAIIYKRFYFQGWGQLWNWQAVNRKTMPFVIMRWLIASGFMLAFLFFYDPARLFYLQRENPDFIPYLLIIYPLISALPQEFIFCTFLFRRYQDIFNKNWKIVLASTVTFAYAHVLFINPVAPVLSLFGGLIFALDYNKHRSLALVTIEHGLYGNSLFLIGLGWYFWHGSVVP